MEKQEQTGVSTFMVKKNNKNYLILSISMIGGAFLALFMLAFQSKEQKDIDFDNPYIDPYNNSKKPSCCRKNQTFYERYGKRILDIIISFLALIMLAPLYGLISVAIYLDDPGPIFFKQKRIGKNKHYIYIHKFRSMRMDTPHDIPTHQLSNPEQYITKIGKILRKYSLDELPQIWDIYCGRMSIIGPRPALWNQDDLVAERDKYGANSVTPGLSGWAQINGRDELEIIDKARLDGEYVKNLRESGLKGVGFDAKCFLGTIKSVIKSDGVVEGGTGKKIKIDSVDLGVDDYGYKKIFHIKKDDIKNVLITGKDSYIGNAFTSYAMEHYPNIKIDTLDMLDGMWKDRSFEGYDAILHVAGIAHADTENLCDEKKDEYYRINKDLAIQVAKKGRDSGVKQFIFMSSMIIYGESAPYGKTKIIDEHTIPNPTNFYGDSKWQADKGIRALKSEDFNVAVLRPPMIYGHGCKGNYLTLSTLAKNLPIFPCVYNERSMLHIDNFCEFLCLLILSGEGGVYFPQNRQYSNTSELVKQINKVKGGKVRTIKLLNPLVMISSHIQGKIGRLTNKAFGNFVYDQKLSQYKGLEYQIVDLNESIKRTEDYRTSSEYKFFDSKK